MQRFRTFLYALFIFAGCTFAQNKMTEFNVGFLGPADAKSGFYGGLNMGRMIDENVGISLGLHIYHSSYTKDSKVGENSNGQITESDYTTEIEQSANLFPLFFQIHYVGPITQLFDLKVTGGIGYELLWNSVTNYSENKDATEFYHGFGWSLGAGVSMPISRASDLFVEAFYHGGSPSRDQGKNEVGLPVRTEIDMSGFGVRVGIRLYSFGL